MELVQPGLGIVFWMLLSFGMVFFILKAFAWKPILNALKEREESIAGALTAAEKTKEEMAMLKADNEKLIQQAMIERDKLLKEAREMKDKIIAEAKTEAASEASKLLAKAHQNIQHEKEVAFSELKNQIAGLSIFIAEKLLHAQLEKDGQQQKLIQQLINDLKIN